MDNKTVLTDDFIGEQISALPDAIPFVTPYFVFARNIERAVIAKLGQPAASEAGAVPFDMIAHLSRQRAWSERTFGPGPRAKGVIDHIRKELREIEADPGDLKKWVDVTILALDGAWRSGATPAQIVDAIVAKQTKNEGRRWPDWRTADPDKAIEHDRSADAAASTQSEKQAAQEQSVLLSGAQLADALEFIAPDRDPDQMEAFAVIRYGDGHSGKGYYCWLDGYPDEGAILLDGSFAAPPGASAESAEPECPRCFGKGETNEGDPEIGDAYFRCDACKGTGTAATADARPRYANQYEGMDGTPYGGERTTADAQGDERAALQTLVDLEDMRLRLRDLHERGHGTDYDDYHKALPKAWDAARAALLRQPSAPASADAATAGTLREPKNGDGWRVEWWSESARMLLPDDKCLYSFQGYKNGTLVFTIKDARAALAAAKPEGGSQ